MKFLWALLPIAVMWQGFYLLHLLEQQAPAWWTAPLFITWLLWFIVSVGLMITKIYRLTYED
jgi:steroid 5-alpha reductase family enzyme